MPPFAPAHVSRRTCEYLVRTHMERNDKVIIFGDNVFSLKKVGRHDVDAPELDCQRPI